MEDGLRRKMTFDGRRPLMEDTFDGTQPLMENNLWRKTTLDRGLPLTEDNLSWKMTFEGRRPLTEENLWRKTTLDWRQPLMEDNLWQKTSFNERQPLTEDKLSRKMTFERRQPLTEEDLWRKTTFDGRRPSIGCIVYYLKNMFSTPHLDSHSTTDPKPEILSAVQTGNRISRDGRNVRGIMHVRMCKKDDICWQRRLNHSGVGGEIAFRTVYSARAYKTLVLLVLKWWSQYCHIRPNLKTNLNWVFANPFCKLGHKLELLIMYL